jgi:hypothetical protein
MPYPWEVAGDAFNKVGQGFGEIGQGVGAKLGQFGNWLGDVTGLNGAKAPERYQFDWTNANQTRGNEMALLNQYQQMAAGNGPSLAQGQLQQATDQNIRQAMALGQAQQGQGMGYASALRSIADQSAAARQQSAAQSAMLRNYEQMGAMQAQGALLGQIGGQDFQQQGMGQQNAYNYDALKANIDAQNAAGKRQFWGGVAGAVGGALSPGGVLTGLFKGGGQEGNGGPGVGYGINAMSQGGQVPGQAASGAMDSRTNDTVPAMLSPGEIVLPRSITMAPDAGERARLFVQEVQRRRTSGPPSDHHLVRQARRKAA